MFQYSDGVPQFATYVESLSSTLVGQLQEFSGDWLSGHSKVLSPYAKKWVADPIRQWSRKWEYPYVASRLPLANGSRPTRILDAGSGVTFFPFWCARELADADVHAVDNDTDFEKLFCAVNEKSKWPVTFTVGDLSDLPFADGFFDCVYCVSVLEHTDSPEAIIGEFKRILSPGGRLILTIDVSPDGEADIPLKQASWLLRQLDEHFGCSRMPRMPGVEEVSSLLTTWAVYTNGVAELPWPKPPLVRRIIHGVRHGDFRRWRPPLLTVYCGVWNRA
jgi:ubiquinone/menaquinone biosynthesis C-methylase UbiE